MNLKRLPERIWCLPQNLLGLLTIKGSKAVKWGTFEECSVYVSPYKFGVSLGEFIILPQDLSQEYHRVQFQRALKHERGHYLQNRMFGPLYLVIIGIPSALFNLLSRANSNFAKDYYKRYPEKWADALGGVTDRV